VRWLSRNRRQPARPARGRRTIDGHAACTMRCRNPHARVTSGLFATAQSGSARKFVTLSRLCLWPLCGVIANSPARLRCGIHKSEDGWGAGMRDAGSGMRDPQFADGAHTLSRDPAFAKLQEGCETASSRVSAAGGVHARVNAFAKSSRRECRPPGL
jgi:hypothetical protein